jgi:sulfur carrier protein
MQITVKLFATLRDGRFESAPVELPEGSLVSDVIAAAGVPLKDAAVIFVNGRHAEHGRPLSPGDAVAVFPPVGGG